MTIDQEGTDKLFKEDFTPIVQDDGEGAPKYEQAKSVKDESHPVEEEEPGTIVDRAPPVD